MIPFISTKIELSITILTDKTNPPSIDKGFHIQNWSFQTVWFEFDRKDQINWGRVSLIRLLIFPSPADLLHDKCIIIQNFFIGKRSQDLIFMEYNLYTSQISIKLFEQYWSHQVVSPMLSYLILRCAQFCFDKKPIINSITVYFMNVIGSNAIHKYANQ